MFQRFISKVQGSIQPTNKLSTGLSTGCGKLFTRVRHAVLTSTFTNSLDSRGTLTARALQGAHSEPLTRRARWVAFVIGIALFVPMSNASSGSIDAIQSVHELADTQLT